MHLKNKFNKIKHLPSFLLCFVFLSITLSYIERNNLDRLAKSIVITIESYNQLLDLKFEQHKKSMSYYDKQNDVLTNDQKSTLLDKLNLSFLSNCSIAVYQESLGEISLIPLPNDVYKKLTFGTQRQLLTMCETVVELEQTSSRLNLMGDYQNIIIKIPEPEKLIDNIEMIDYSFVQYINNTNEADISWIVTSRAMPVVDYVNAPFNVWNIKPLTNGTSEIYFPQVWTKFKPLDLESSVYFGDLIDLFDFSQVFRNSHVEQMFIELKDINNFATINWSHTIKYLPFIMLIAFVLYVIVIYVLLNIKRLHQFIKTLNTVEFSLISLDLHLHQQSIVFSNILKSRSTSEPYKYLYYDKKLMLVDSITKAEYVHINTPKESYRFTLVGSTFLRENQRQGTVLLIESGSAQDNIKHYETVYKIDALTKLPNRTELEEFICLSQSSSTCFMMAIIDLDHFKKVNDTFGHHFGDLVLQHSADHLRRSIKLNNLDRIIRLGGEEFMVLIETTKDSYLETSKSISQRIIEFNQDSLSFSGGVVYWDPTVKPYNSAYKHCDKLLYAAKENGRHQIQIEVSENKTFTISDIPELGTSDSM